MKHPIGLCDEITLSIKQCQCHCLHIEIEICVGKKEKDDHHRSVCLLTCSGEKKKSRLYKRNQLSNDVFNANMRERKKKFFFVPEDEIASVSACSNVNSLATSSSCD